MAKISDLGPDLFLHDRIMGFYGTGQNGALYLAAEILAFAWKAALAGEEDAAIWLKYSDRAAIFCAGLNVSHELLCELLSRKLNGGKQKK